MDNKTSKDCTSSKQPQASQQSNANKTRGRDSNMIRSTAPSLVASNQQATNASKSEDDDLNFVRRTKELRLKEDGAQKKPASTPGVAAVSKDDDLNYVRRTKELHLKEDGAQRKPASTPSVADDAQILPGRADFVSNNNEVSLQVMIQIKMHFYYLHLIRLMMLFD